MFRRYRRTILPEGAKSFKRIYGGYHNDWKIHILLQRGYEKEKSINRAQGFFFFPKREPSPLRRDIAQREATKNEQASFVDYY
jgi:hypothetical protein